MRWHDMEARDLVEWLMMGSIMLLLWGALIAVVVWAVHGSWNRRPDSQSLSPDELLDARFASGEISADELILGRELLGTAPRTT